MKDAAILSLAALTALLTSVTVAAQARDGGVRPPEQSIPHSVSVSSAGPDDPSVENEMARVEVRLAPGKTRAQVRAELLQAGEEGMFPLHWADYPPGAVTRARNRENYLRLEQAWKAEGIIPATSVSSSD
jgi:hypothetical protein